MKRSGLTPCLAAATLFLASGLGAEEAASPAKARPAAKETKEEGAVATAGREVPAKPKEDEVAQAKELIARFDKNGDGKLDLEETVAMRRFFQENAALVPANAEVVKGVVRNPSPAEEQARLEAVAEEVARRRVLREQAAEGIAKSGGKPPVTPATTEKSMSAAQTIASRLAEYSPEEVEAVRAEQLKRFDRNGDGKLDATETKELLKIMRINTWVQLERDNAAHDRAGDADKARLARIAEEVAKRREAREKASEPVEKK